MTADWDNHRLAEAMVSAAIRLELDVSIASELLREAARRLDPPTLPEPSRAGHYS